MGKVEVGVIRRATSGSPACPVSSGGRGGGALLHLQEPTCAGGGACTFAGGGVRQRNGNQSNGIDKICQKTPHYQKAAPTPVPVPLCPCRCAHAGVPCARAGVRRNALDRPTAEALAGLTRLRELRVRLLVAGPPTASGDDLDRASAVECAAAVAALPAELKELLVDHLGSCAEGAALVVPPGRAQQLELRFNSRMSDTGTLCMRTGRATVEDVGAFMRWMKGSIHDMTLVLGGCVGAGVLPSG